MMFRFRKFRIKKRWHLINSFLIIGIVTFYCEYLSFYIALLQCQWPHVDNWNDDYIKVMIISDIHILGDVRGQFLDKLHHEWQMYRSFQTALELFNPQYVFILGDVFEEGEIASDEQYQRYIRRFKSIFLGNSEEKDITRLSNGQYLYSIVGNHDIGFHYTMNKFLKTRFDKTFQTDSVDLIRINGINFVTINSITMEGDHCELCSDAESKLIKMSQLLCPNGTKDCDKNRPILLSHFPLYRISDKDCDETDEAPSSIKYDIFKQRWDCLSQNATNLLLKTLNPRLIFTGHVHYGCVTLHNNVQEWTVASFNWRNIHSPTFLLVKLSSNKYAINKCILPNEITVIVIYIITGISLLFSFRNKFIMFFIRMRRK